MNVLPFRKFYKKLFFVSSLKDEIKIKRAVKTVYLFEYQLINNNNGLKSQFHYKKD
jgi:hypothetical protein